MALSCIISHVKPDTEIVHCFPGPSRVLFIWPYLVEHSSSSATALITDTRTVQVFAQGVIVCVIVTAHALVTVLCYLCVLKCLFIIIIILVKITKFIYPTYIQCPIRG